MDNLLWSAGYLIGYCILPIIAFIFGYIISKSTGKNWGYILAIVFSILYIVVITIGTRHNNSIGS